MKKEQKYTVANAIELYNKSHADHSVIPFWKVWVNGRMEPYGCFCQWYKATFTDDVNTYSCAEQYMMYQKAMLFGDTEVAALILKEANPAEMKNYGRLVKNYNQSIWNEHKYDIVFTGNMLKFTQNKDIQRILLKTKDHILCEASPFDKIWGIGMSQYDSNVNNPANWHKDAQNLLGFALMEVRDIIFGC